MKSFFRKCLSTLMSFVSPIAFIAGYSHTPPNSYTVIRPKEHLDNSQLYLEHASALQSSDNGVYATHRSHSSHASHASHYSSSSTSSSSSSKSTSSSSHSFPSEINHSPIAKDMNVTVMEDISKKFKINAEDKDKKNILTYSIVDMPQYGKLEISQNEVLYIPNQDYYGPDNFKFKANDGYADSNIAVVSITVLPVNDFPISESQDISIIKNTLKTITLSATDPDYDSLKYTIQTKPKHGTLTGNGDIITYRPSPDYIGIDSFTFIASDGKLNSKQAAISIIIRSENINPQSMNQDVNLSKDMNADIILQATDPENDKLVYFVYSPPSHGKLISDEVGSNKLMYKPNLGFVGTDKFAFKANDGFSDSNLATVTIIITPINKN